MVSPYSSDCDYSMSTCSISHGALWANDHNNGEEERDLDRDTNTIERRKTVEKDRWQNRICEYIFSVGGDEKGASKIAQINLAATYDCNLRSLVCRSISLSVCQVINFSEIDYGIFWCYCSPSLRLMPQLQMALLDTHMMHHQEKQTEIWNNNFSIWRKGGVVTLLTARSIALYYNFIRI